MSNLVTFITTFHEEDYTLLRLQARSIAKFAPADLVDEIILVSNCSNALVDGNLDIFKLLFTQLPMLYGIHKDKLRIIDPRKEPCMNNQNFQRLRNIASCDSLSGWRSQQAIKIASSLFSKSDHLIILDAKNHFIRPISFNSFYDEKDRCIVKFFKRDRVQSNWLNASLRYLKSGLHPIPDNTPLPPTITPYPTKLSIISSIIEYIEKRGDSLEGIFSHPGIKATEFYLILSYYITYIGSVDSGYVDSSSPQATIFSKYPEDAEQVAKTIKVAASQQSISFALHPKRIQKIGDENWAAITKMWKEIGILDQEVCDYYYKRVV